MCESLTCEGKILLKGDLSMETETVNKEKTFFFSRGKKKDEGRRRRSEDRRKASLRVIFTSRQGRFYCKTVDISESGLSVTLDSPYYVREDEEVLIHFRETEFDITLSAKVVNVLQLGDSVWSYSMKITDFHENKNEWINVVNSVGIVVEDSDQEYAGDKFKKIKVKYVLPSIKRRRCYPRVILDTKFENPAFPGGYVTIHDFNYIYVTIPKDSPEIESFKFNMVPEALFVCRFECVLDSGYKLYRILNIDEVMGDLITYGEVLTYLRENGKNL